MRASLQLPCPSAALAVLTCRRPASPSPCRRRSYVAGARPWELGAPSDIAFPCATQNELEEDDALVLAANGCK